MIILTQKERRKQKNKPAENRNAGLRRKEEIKAVKMRSQGELYMLFGADLKLLYSLGWLRGEVLGRIVWKVAMKHTSSMQELWR